MPTYKTNAQFGYEQLYTAYEYYDELQTQVGIWIGEGKTDGTITEITPPDPDSGQGGVYQRTWIDEASAMAYIDYIQAMPQIPDQLPPPVPTLAELIIE